MSLLSWIFGSRPAPVAEEQDDERDEQRDAAMQESLRRDDWLRVYAAVYAEGLTGKVMAMVHAGGTEGRTTQQHLIALRDFAARAADEAVAMADDRFPLTAPPPIILDKVKTPTPPITLNKVKTPTVPATALPTGVIRGEVKPDGTLAVISSTSGEANNPAS